MPEDKTVSKSQVASLESTKFTLRELNKKLGRSWNTKMSTLGIQPYLEYVQDTTPQQYVLSGHWEWRWRYEHGAVV